MLGERPRHAPRRTTLSMSSVSHAQAAHLSARRRRTRAPSGVSERRERPPSLRAYPPPHSSSLQRVCLQHATEHEVGPARRQFRLGTGELSLETPPTVQGEPANCARRARQLFKESPPTVQGGPANCARSARQLFKESPPTVQREPANCSSRAHQLCKEGPPTVQGEPANCSRRAGTNAGLPGDETAHRLVASCQRPAREPGTSGRAGSPCKARLQKGPPVPEARCALDGFTDPKDALRGGTASPSINMNKRQTQ